MPLALTFGAPSLAPIKTLSVYRGGATSILAYSLCQPRVTRLGWLAPVNQVVTVSRPVGEILSMPGRPSVREKSAGRSKRTGNNQRRPKALDQVNYNNQKMPKTTAHA